MILCFYIFITAKANNMNEIGVRIAYYLAILPMVDKIQV
jgi:hypothetical protein